MKTAEQFITHKNNSSSKTQNGTDVWFRNQILFFEKNRFALMTVFILFQSCLGSIACMFISQGQSDVVQLSVCAAITMGTNALFIAQSPGKWCLGALTISVALNLLMIFINL